LKGLSLQPYTQAILAQFAGTHIGFEVIE